MSCLFSSHQTEFPSRKIASSLLALAVIASLLMAGGLLSVVSAAPSAPWTIEVTSQETLWVDANKCNAQGPRGAWLSFWITNTTGVQQDNVLVTFSGFSGANAGLFVATADPQRDLGTMAPGEREAIYYYVDYSAVCNQTPLDGRTATYSVTVQGSTQTNTYNGTVTTNTLLTASAAGVVASNVIGPGVWLGQLLDQTVVYEFNNNTDLFFQPAAEALFQDGCLRLADMHVAAISANVTGIPQQPDNRLWFPNGDVSPSPGELGQITVVFYWEVRCVGTVQNASPWSAAKSGQKYKYTAVGTPVSIPPAQPSLSAAKSGPNCVQDVAPQTATYTVTFTNITGSTVGVPVFLKRIDDILPSLSGYPGCVRIANPTVSPLSDVTTGNTSVVPAVNATGTVSWISKYQGIATDDNIKGWRIPSLTQNVNNTWNLVFTADFSLCPTDVSRRYTNQALGNYGNNILTNTPSWEVVYPCTPLAITLADFSAIQQGDFVLLTWETNSELNNRGFNLYRGTSMTGPDRQLNDALIPSQSQGSPGGFIYIWEDRADLQAGTTYFYWVEDVDVSGTATRHGPVSVDFVTPTAVTISSMDVTGATGSAIPVAGTLLALLLPLAGGLAATRRRRRL